MKHTSYRWNTYCLYDYRGVEEHLSAMTAKGWRLERAGNNLWKYRRAQPAEVLYAVTYSAGASQFNPGPTQGQQSLEELCASAGWEKVCDWFQMQIFSTENPSAVPLETDEALRLEGLHRSMRKSFLPTTVVLLAFSLLFAASFLYSLISGNMYRLFSSNAQLFSGTMFLLLAGLEAYTLWHYYHWRKVSLRAVGEGGTCVPLGPGYRRLSAALLALVAVLAAGYLLLEILTGGSGRALFYLVYLALFFLLVFLVRRTSALLRKLRASKSVNIALTLAVDVVLAIALVGGLAYGVVRFHWFFGLEGETYVYQHIEWDLSPREDFPLTLTDLTGEHYAHIRRRLFESGSFFLPEREYSETALPQDETESGLLRYTLWDPKFPRLQQALLREQLKTGGYNGPLFDSHYAYVPEDPIPWGAETAYRLHIDGSPKNAWLLAWPGRVVEVSLGGALSEAPKALIAARLGPGT